MSFDNAKQREVKEKLKFTGVGEVEVVAVNPTKEQLDALLGVETDKEPSYITEKADGSKSTRITFWLKPKGYETLVPMSIFLDHSERKSSSGKYQFMNNQLKETWANTIEEVMDKINNTDMGNWFKPCGLRKAYGGEFQLYDFLITLGNLDIINSEDIQLDNLNAILSGDMTEIRNILNTFNQNNNGSATVKVLFGINDKGYQDVYTGGFMNARSNRYTSLEKKATGEYGSFKSNYGGSMEFSKYEGDAAPQEKETSVSAQKSSMY